MPSASSSSSTREPVAADQREVLQQRVDVGDRVRGPAPQPGLAAQCPRPACSVIVARIALPAAEACGSSRWPSGVWKRTLPGPSTRSMNTGKPSSQIASRDVIFVRSDSSVEQRPAQVAERQLSAGDVAQPDQRRAQGVAGARPAVAQHPERGHASGPAPASCSSTRPRALARSLSDRPSAGPSATISHQLQRAGHAADRVPARRAGRRRLAVAVLTSAVPASAGLAPASAGRSAEPPAA